MSVDVRGETYASGAAVPLMLTELRLPTIKRLCHKRRASSLGERLCICGEAWIKDLRNED